MAKQLKKLDDLKSAFGKFDEMSALVDKVKGEIDDVNKKNVAAGGNDEIGKKYHEQVDKPTENLTVLVGAIRDKLQSIGLHGQGTADLFDRTDEHNTQLVR
ncbi:hypothetical protein [Kitasatospora sp. NPDC097643]|uniref:hypothetical protein n=1 Tax=Kitasatospora sp. NPDC097643 TaxID=3157230 RepID=UPI00331E02D4